MGDFQQFHVLSRVDLLIAPLREDVRLVPDLNVTHPALIVLDELVDKVAIVIEVIGRTLRVGVILTCPIRGTVEASNDLEAVPFTKVNDLVIFLPGALPAGFVYELSLASRLNFRPNDMLFDPANPRFLGHLDGFLALPFFHLASQKQVRSIGIDIGIRDRSGRGALDLSRVHCRGKMEQDPSQRSQNQQQA